MRLALLIEHVGPYHAARLGAISGRLLGDELVVIEVAGDSGTSAWPLTDLPIARTTLFPDRRYEHLTSREVARAVRSALSAIRPTVVAVNGWGFPEARAAIGWAVRRRAGLVLLSDSRREDTRRSWFREALKGRFVRACGAAFVAGSPHRTYLIELGMEAERIFTGYDSVDNEAFRMAARAARAAGTSRQRSGLPARFAIAVGRLIPEKDYTTLLRAHADHLVAQPDGLDLLVVGEGPLRCELQALAEDLGTGGRVHLVGRRPNEELPALLALAECYVQASRKDTWGLAVNEAMAAELPVLLSRGCGCAVDLVEEGINGWTFAPGDAAALRELLGRVLSADRTAMGRASGRLIDAFGLDQHAEGFLKAAKLAAAKRREVGWLDPVRYF